MFGFGARLPVDDKTKNWIDLGFERLETLFGKDAMLKAEVILPIDKYFPDKYEKNEAGLEILLGRVCTFMGVERSSVELAIIPDHVEEFKEHLPFWTQRRSGAAGFYSHDHETNIPVVAIRDKLAADPMTAVAVIAHELAHVILLGEKQLDREAEDMEPLTDLATVFLGLGIFNANAAFRYEKHQNVRTQGWSVSRTGYLSEEMFGYALAKFAFERSEPRPAWCSHLAPNIRGHFNRSLKWFFDNKRHEN